MSGLVVPAVGPAPGRAATLGDRPRPRRHPADIGQGANGNISARALTLRNSRAGEIAGGQSWPKHLSLHRRSRPGHIACGRPGKEAKRERQAWVTLGAV